MMYIPVGFAHGFLTLSEEAHLIYKCGAEYDKERDGGIAWMIRMSALNGLSAK